MPSGNSSHATLIEEIRKLREANRELVAAGMAAMVALKSAIAKATS